MNSQQKQHRNTSKVSLLDLFEINKNIQYLPFADLSILFLIQSLNGCL